MEENSIEKIYFPIISGKVARNRALENNVRFLQQYFPISGGGEVPVFPLPGAYDPVYRILNLAIIIKSNESATTD